MKKLFKILVPIVLVVIVFSPFTLESQKNEPILSLSKKVASAAHCPPGQVHITVSGGGTIDTGACGTPEQAATAQNGKSSVGCDWIDLWCNFKKGVALAMLMLSGSILFGAGVLLNYAVDYTVIRMADFVNNLTVIDTGWQTFRDLANITFIFILIYIAVSTILSLSTRATRKTLVSIIIVALLLNFSLFFTKVIIDTSNIIAIQFYNGMNVGPSTNYNTGISWTFMRGTALTTFFKVKSTSSSVGSFDDLEVKDFFKADGQNMFVLGLMGSIFMLITAFVFFATAIMLVTRFVILVFLMITSPLAYVAAIVPGISGFSGKWWRSLMSQSIFVIVLMMLLWFSASVINDPKFQKFVLGDNNAVTEESFSSGIVGGKVDSVDIILNYLIVMAFVIGSLTAAKAAGAAGSGFANKWAGKLSFGTVGFLGRQTFGRGFNAAAERLQKTTFGSTRIGGATVRQIQGLADKKYDIRNTGLGTLAKGVGVDLGETKAKGFRSQVKEAVKEKEEYAKNLPKEPVVNKDAKTAYEGIQKDLDNNKKLLSQISKEIADAIKAGDNLDALVNRRKAAEKTQKGIMATLEEFKSNPDLGQSPQLRYAEAISPTKRKWYKPTSWNSLLISQADTQAGKKIRESAKKDPNKKLKEALKDATDDEEATPTTGGGATGGAGKGTSPGGTS